MKNFKEIEREIEERFSTLKKYHNEAMAMIKTAVERLAETNKEIAELEKTKDELTKKVESKNVNK